MVYQSQPKSSELSYCHINFQEYIDDFQIVLIHILVQETPMELQSLNW